MRTALNVAFTASAVRQYQELFEKVARTVSLFIGLNGLNDLRIQISSKLEAASEGVVDVCQVLGAGTLSAIAEGQFLTSMVDHLPTPSSCAGSFCRRVR
jgi:hypothetical protein